MPFLSVFAFFAIFCLSQAIIFFIIPCFLHFRNAVLIIFNNWIYFRLFIKFCSKLKFNFDLHFLFCYIIILFTWKPSIYPTTFTHFIINVYLYFTDSFSSLLYSFCFWAFSYLCLVCLFFLSYQIYFNFLASIFIINHHHPAQMLQIYYFWLDESLQVHPLIISVTVAY